MNNEALYDCFLEILSTKYPKRMELSKALMDLLYLEREAVYRRLRKDVIFPVHEVAKIASEWNISLDEVVGINSGKVPFQMQVINYLNPSKEEFINMQKRVKLLEHIEFSSNTEFMEVSNRLPRPISTGFMQLYRFEIFNWAYQYGNEETYRKFSKVFLSKELEAEFQEYDKIMKYVTNSYFILDRNTFRNMVSNIKYFHSILLITDEEKDILKKDLFSLLDYLITIANKGCYPETQNKIYLYISQLNVDTNYSYFYTEQLKTCRIHAFGKYDISSFDLEMVENFRTWMQLKKRTAIQISEVDAKSRIDFFSEQQQVVETL